MAAKNPPTLLTHLLTALLLLLSIITASVRADHSFDINPNPSPEASTSLICPNDNPTDCYPALFQPNVHFQKIRPDQSLPPGLHVRMNIQTGEKEARLNVPEEGENNREAVVVVDDAPPEPEAVGLGLINDDPPLHLRLHDEPKQEKHARPYTPPRPAALADPDEVVLYEAAISILKQKSFIDGRSNVVLDHQVADALETLTELAHSLEWGLTICRDAELTRTLLTFIGAYLIEGHEQIDQQIRSASLLLLATAVQNNQDALSALQEATHNDIDYHRPLHGILQSLALEAERESGDPNIVARAIFFLSQICVDDKVLAAYLSTDTMGLSHLLHLFASSISEAGAGQTKLRHRIANFVEDHAERIATLSDFRLEDITEKLVDTLLRPWCDVFSIALQKHGDGLIEVLEAKEELGKVLETHTGHGCTGGLEHGAQQEL